MYDTIIVGGGAAGLSAAIYAVRRSLKTLLLSKDIGGQTATTPAIENYPGFESLNGLELMVKFQQQAEHFGAEIRLDEVTKVERQTDGTFAVSTPTKTFVTQSVIFCQGLTHRRLGVKGEDGFFGKGVSYCATCDAPLFRGKPTAVVGGGSAALDAALLLSTFSPKVFLIHRRNEFRGEEILERRVRQTPNIELMLNSIIQEITGDAVVTGVTISDAEEPSKTRQLAVAGVFVEIGFSVDDRLIRGLVELTERNEVKINRECETSVPGIFAAGDITTVKYKQTVIAAGEGATAALQAYEYILKRQGRTPSANPDWTTSDAAAKAYRKMS